MQIDTPWCHADKANQKNHQNRKGRRRLLSSRDEFTDMQVDQAEDLRVLGRAGAAGKATGAPWPTDAYLEKYDFESGLVLGHTFSEMTFLHVQVRFAILFIPVAIDLAVSGSTWGKLGLKAFVDPKNPFEIRGGVSPGATAVLTIEVSVDIFIARIGIGGELNIIQASIPAVSTWKPSNTQNRFAITLGVSLELLGGRIYAFVELGFWCSNLFCA